MAANFPTASESEDHRIQDGVFLNNENEPNMAWQNISDALSMKTGRHEFVPHVSAKVNSDTEVHNNSSGQQPVPDVAIDVPSNIDVSNNPGPQFVPHVSAKVNSDTEVHNNSSGQQPVLDVAIDVPSNIDVSNNHGPQFVPHVSAKVNSDTEVHNNSSGQQPVPDVAIDVPSNIDVSNNPGPQFVPHVSAKVNSDIEVHNNSSGQQPVPDVAIDVPSNIDVSNNPGPQEGNNYGDWMPAALFSFADCVAAIVAHFIRPRSSREPVYLVVAEVIIFIAGVLEALATLWMSCDVRKRRTAERMIMYTSFVTLILGIGLDIYAYVTKK